MTRQHRAVIFASFLALALVLGSFMAQIVLKPLPPQDLAGIGINRRRPAFSLSDFVSEKFQKKMEYWLTKANPIWPRLVEISNQLTFDLFGQVSLNYGSTVLVGHQGQFFQPMYLGAFNRSREVPSKVIVKKVKQLKRLQDLLAKRNIPMILLISTNLLDLYPELVPGEFTDPTRLSRQGSYDMMRPLLDQYGINYIDAHELLSGLKASFPRRFFEPTASHWNNPAACRVTSLLIRRIAALTGKLFNPMRCEECREEFPPRAADRDLVEIANLLNPEEAYRPGCYVSAEAAPDPSAYKPRLLFVGSSFVFSVLNQIEHFKVAAETTFYFYYRKVAVGPGLNFKDFSRTRLDWEKSIFSNDAVILERNRSSIGSVGFDFVKDAIRQLEGEDKAPGAKRRAKGPKKPRTK